MFIRDFVELSVPVDEMLARVDAEVVGAAAADASRHAYALLHPGCGDDARASSLTLGPSERHLGAWSRSFRWCCAGLEEIFTECDGHLTMIPVADSRSELLLTATCRPTRRFHAGLLRTSALADLTVRHFLMSLRSAFEPAPAR